MIGLRMVQISAIYIVIGLLMGLAMGITRDFSFMSVHAHISLLGWTTMSITGLVYTLIPACSRSRLATIHCCGHNLGLPVMMASLMLEACGNKSAEKALAASSTLVLVSLLLFAVNLFLHGKRDLPQ